MKRAYRMLKIITGTTHLFVTSPQGAHASQVGVLLLGFSRHEPPWKSSLHSPHRPFPEWTQTLMPYWFHLIFKLKLLLVRSVFIYLWLNLGVCLSGFCQISSTNLHLYLWEKVTAAEAEPAPALELQLPNDNRKKLCCYADLQRDILRSHWLFQGRTR